MTKDCPQFEGKDAATSYGNQLSALLTSLSSLDSEVRREFQEILDEFGGRLSEAALSFLVAEIDPASTYDFERQILGLVRELARQVVERVYNAIESDEAEDMPHHVTYEAGGYRRRNQRTANRNVSTLFGGITLWRYSYRYWHRDQGEGVIFPLEMQLGLVHGATPALAECAARYMAEAGATQRSVLERLAMRFDARWGPDRLRNVVADISDAMVRFPQEFQVIRILELLETADKSAGRRKPVLAVGRDGVTLREYRHSFWEHATAGTVTVYDRRGRRLGTVYLAMVPESGQHAMTTQLTALIRSVLDGWRGNLPLNQS